MSDPMIWGCCEGITDSNDDDRVKRRICHTYFHVLCLQPTNVKESETLRINSKNWKCPLCAEVKGSRNDDTPVRSDSSKNITSRSKKRMALSSSPQPIESALTGETIREIIRQELKTMMKESLSRMNKVMCNILNSKLKEVTSEVQSLKDSIQFLNDQYEDIIKEYKSATETISLLQHQNVKSESRLNDLSQQINILEQNARANNIEIQCLPEDRNENLVKLVQTLNIILGVDVREEQFLHCTRIAKKNKDSNRPISVIVQFNTPLTRDKVLAAVSTFNKAEKLSDKLNSSHIGFSGEQKPIYIMELQF